MTNMENKEVARRLIDSFNRRNMDQALQMISEQAQWQDVPSQNVFRGKEGFKQFQQSWLTAFPDGKIEITDIVEGAEGVVVEYVGRGTHTGPFRGPDGMIEATGKRVELRLCDVMRIQNGRVAFGRTYYDVATLMRQLGIRHKSTERRAA